MESTQLVSGAGLTGPLISVAKARSGPAPTLVVDGRPLGADASRGSALQWLLPARSSLLADRSDLGAKNAVVLPVDRSTLRVEFFQGRPDGTIDDSIVVCGNSAAACVSVARHLWHLLDDGEIVVLMGEQAFAYLEV